MVPGKEPKSCLPQFQSKDNKAMLVCQYSLICRLALRFLLPLSMHLSCSYPSELQQCSTKEGGQNNHSSADQRSKSPFRSVDGTSIGGTRARARARRRSAASARGRSHRSLATALGSGSARSTASVLRTSPGETRSFASTLGHVLHSAGRNGRERIVLDKPVG